MSKLFEDHLHTTEIRSGRPVKSITFDNPDEQIGAWLMAVARSRPGKMRTSAMPLIFALAEIAAREGVMPARATYLDITGITGLQRSAINDARNDLEALGVVRFIGQSEFRILMPTSEIAEVQQRPAPAPNATGERKRGSFVPRSRKKTSEIAEVSTPAPPPHTPPPHPRIRIPDDDVDGLGVDGVENAGGGSGTVAAALKRAGLFPDQIDTVLPKIKPSELSVLEAWIDRIISDPAVKKPGAVIFTRLRDTTTPWRDSYGRRGKPPNATTTDQETAEFQKRMDRYK